MNNQSEINKYEKFTMKRIKEIAKDLKIPNTKYTTKNKKELIDLIINKQKLKLKTRTDKIKYFKYA